MENGSSVERDMAMLSVSASSAPIDIPKTYGQRISRVRTGSHGTSTLTLSLKNRTIALTPGPTRGRSFAQSASPSPATTVAMLTAASSPKSSSVAKQPKKGGHGKGNWGKLGSEHWNPVTVSSGDPNFDDDTMNTKIKFVETVFPISPQEMSDYLRTPLAEYFQNADVDEFFNSLSKVSSHKLNSDIVAFVLTEACSMNDPERELASKLLLSLCTTRNLVKISPREISDGFHLVLSQLDDLVLDTPNADHVMAKFIARAVSDELVPPAFVLSFNFAGARQHLVRNTMLKAVALISNPQGLARLEHIWGMSGARTPVRDLQNQVNMILKEFVDTGYVHEAERCIREMRAVHFHHEVVSQIVRMAIENDNSHLHVLITLLQELTKSKLVSEHQLVMGLARVVNDLDDICIDSPLARVNLKDFFVSASSLIPAPFRASPDSTTLRGTRKRSISESTSIRSR